VFSRNTPRPTRVSIALLAGGYVTLCNSAARESRQQHHHKAHRLGRQGARRASRPATRPRREPALIPQAIDELLRYEPPAPHTEQHVTRDVEYYGQTVPQGSVLMMIVAAACRDHRQYPPDGDVFDIHREPRQHLAFGGAHYCLGSTLARLMERLRWKRFSNGSRTGTSISKTPVSHRHPLFMAGATTPALIP
jgi:cytochrome P450